MPRMTGRPGVVSDGEPCRGRKRHRSRRPKLICLKEEVPAGRRSHVAASLTIVTLAAIGWFSGSAYAENRTTANIFQAFTPHGFIKMHTRSKAGYCWVGTLTSRRRDGWRCSVGNYIHDPCFSSAQNPGIVVCPDAPWLKTGVRIRLTKPLPRVYGNRSAPSLRLQPWAIELYDGRRCLFSTGATSAVEGQRLNYFCEGSSEEGLWGFPYRGSEPWTILIAPFEATELSERAAVRHAWM